MQALTAPEHMQSVVSLLEGDREDGGFPSAARREHNQMKKEVRRLRGGSATFRVQGLFFLIGSKFLIFSFC